MQDIIVLAFNTGDEHQAAMAGAFIRCQAFLSPLIRICSIIGIYNTLAGIVVVHVIFGLPPMTLLFSNYYSVLQVELFDAGRGGRPRTAA